MSRLSFMFCHGNTYVTLFASKLAQLADMHPYCEQEELAKELAHHLGTNPFWKCPQKLAEEEYKSLPIKQELDEVRTASYDSAKQVQRVLKKVKQKYVERPVKVKAVHNAMQSCSDKEQEHIKQVLKGEGDISNITSVQVKQAITELNGTKVEDIEKEMVALPPTVFDLVQRDLYTKHGNEQEEGIRQSLKKDIDKNKNKFVVSDKPFIKLAKTDVYLGGRHDGMTKEGRIIEIKTRQRRFLGTPTYELVQVHAYMFIYGKEEAQIVESWNGETRVHDVPFDPVFWETVKDSVTQFFNDHWDQGQNVEQL